MPTPVVDSTVVAARTDDVARRSPALLLLLLTIVIFGAALRIHYFNAGLYRTPDERTYTRQADIVRTQGADGFRFLGRELAADLPAVSLYPSPMRVGYITLLAAFMRLTGDASAVAGAHLSLLCSLASLLLIAVMAWRFLSPTSAIVATLFLAVFPLDLTIFRRSWQESFIAVLTVAILFLCVQIARSARPAIYLVAFAILGLLALTTKENSGVTFLLCAAGLTLHFMLQRNRRAAILTAFCAAAAVVTYVVILSLLFGGFVNAFELARACARVSATNPYDLQFNSAPMWMFAAGLFRVSPFLFLMATVGLIATLRSAFRNRPFADAGLPLGVALITACLLLIQLITHRYSFRYTAPIFDPICLLAGLGVDAILPALQKLLAPLGRVAVGMILGFAVLVAAFRDFEFAREHLILPEVQDLSLRPLLGLSPIAQSPQNPR